MLVYNSRDCIQLSILLSFVIAIILTPKIRRDIHYGLLKRLIIGSIFGTPIGLLLYIYMSLDLLKVFVGIVTFMVACFSLVKWYNNQIVKTLVKEENEVNKIETKRLVYGQRIVDMCSGILTTSIGMLEYR